MILRLLHGCVNLLFGLLLDLLLPLFLVAVQLLGIIATAFASLILAIVLNFSCFSGLLGEHLCVRVYRLLINRIRLLVVREFVGGRLFVVFSLLVSTIFILHSGRNIRLLLFFFLLRRLLLFFFN